MAVMSQDQVRRLFAQEADIRLAKLSQLLLQLEETGHDDELVRSIFRELHTIKGSSAVAGLDEVSRVAHDLEELVDDLRAGRRLVTAEIIDTLLTGTDELIAVIAGAPATQTLAPAAQPAQRQAAALTTAGVPPQPLPAAVDRRPPEERSAVGTTRANGASALQITVPVAAGLPESLPNPPGPGPADHRSPPTNSPVRVRPHPNGDAGVIMVPVERLEELTRLVGESASAHLRVGRMLRDRFNVDPATCAEFNELSRSLNDLQDRAMRTQMVPVSTITDQLHRAVRDLARAQGKDVRWDARGTDTELDRGVLSQLAESLTHLIRNAVDHGIETPEQRRAAGKTPQATLRFHAMQLGSEVIIAVTDDGRGIDVDSVRGQAGRHGIETKGMTEVELLALTLTPGLSTAAFVTDLSGRGVGLDVVRANVDAVHGRVEIRSERKVGTEFRIIVPITVAVLRCLLVDVAGQSFALPFHRVLLSRAVPDTAAALHAEGRPIIWVDKHAVPVQGLAETLGLGAGTPSTGPVVVLADTAHRQAFQVDRLIGQRDVVVKVLQPPLPRLPAVAGVSVEPDGSVLIVLDPPGLIQRARAAGRSNGHRDAAASPTARRRSILVVDDALTIRELQRSILERAGFDVRVATDGRHALAALAEGESDLVLTDVEMPNMDGFALTEAIRAHSTYANIPVIILSSRASESDRQRGLDAGADGYITKSGFDETALLTAVNRLIGTTA